MKEFGGDLALKACTPPGSSCRSALEEEPEPLKEADGMITPRFQYLFIQISEENIIPTL